MNPHSQQPRQALDLSQLDLTGIAPLEAPPEFVQGALALHINFEDGDVERLGHYLALLLKVNETVNLTAIKDAPTAWMRHILDSLTLLPLLSELPEGARVIDVGSGGGLPGLPLAITMPHLHFTLLEATGKKAAFLENAVLQLGLKNVTVLAERAEVAAHDRGTKISQGGQTMRVGAHRESYDAVLARAVGRLNTLAEITVPFAKPPGRLADAEGAVHSQVSDQVGDELPEEVLQDDDALQGAGIASESGAIYLIKGQQADTEVTEALPALHALKAVHVSTIDTPTGRIVILRKGAATPRTFPRNDGEPKRSPLGKVRTAAPAKDSEPQARPTGGPTGRPSGRPTGRPGSPRSGFRPGGKPGSKSDTRRGAGMNEQPNQRPSGNPGSTPEGKASPKPAPKPNKPGFVNQDRRGGPQGFGKQSQSGGPKGQASGRFSGGGGRRSKGR